MFVNRWPGASLIVIRGHKHLHECAYIGDNSSEELDELMEAIREKGYVEQNQNFTSEEDAPANEPDKMKRHRSDVQFHHPVHKNRTKSTIKEAIDTSDITDPKLMKKILESLQFKSGKHQNTAPKDDKHVHKHRNSTIANEEKRNIFIQAPNLAEGGTKSQEILDDIMKKLENLGNKSSSVLEKLNKKFKDNKIVKIEKHHIPETKLDVKGRHYVKPAIRFDDNIDKARKRRDIVIEPALQENLNEDDEANDLAIEEGFTPDGIADHRGTVNETTLNDYSNSEFWSSFSSSEEALLNCAGLILNLPLTPHHKCLPDLTEERAEETYLANRITYK